MFEKLLKDGYLRARVDGQMILLEDVKPLEKNKKHSIDVVVDRIVKTTGSAPDRDDSWKRQPANGIVVVLAGENELLFSQNYSCPKCGFSVRLEPRLFSFNSPLGA